MTYLELTQQAVILLRLVNIKHHLTPAEQIKLESKIATCIRRLNEIEPFDTNAALDQFITQGTV